MQLFSGLFGRKRDAAAVLPPEGAPVNGAPSAAAPADIAGEPVAAAAATDAAALEVAIAPNDPLLAWLQNSGTVADVENLRLESPALTRLREAGIKLVVPLVSQGELLGIISLGPRRSDQDYSSDDRRLLSDLASRAAPAVRVAQLVRQQQAEASERERLASEMRVARIIQETLLPKVLPNLPGYAIAAYWQPARAVGGDFYDFIQFDDGSLALIVGDVTDKGVPAALVMSTTRTVLRAVAERARAPGEVLRRANEILCPDIPPKMFITCLFAVLDPATGVLRYANAGHDLPYLRTADGVQELRATGMPLGLLPGMVYEEKEVTLQPSETVLFYSDGLVEAHNPAREMFSFRRLRDLVGGHEGGAGMIPYLLDQLAGFVGRGWEQEDDVTLVTLQHMAAMQQPDGTGPAEEPATLLTAFTVSSAPGNEREAMERVGRAAERAGLLPAQVARLQTAVAEATMNAMEHGNQYNPQLTVAIQVMQTPSALTVRITDHGGGRPIPTSPTPDLDAKLEGLQSPRGWGLFLIKNMVDQMETTTDELHHTIALTMLRWPAAAARALPPAGDAARTSDAANAGANVAPTVALSSVSAPAASTAPTPPPAGSAGEGEP